MLSNPVPMSPTRVVEKKLVYECRLDMLRIGFRDVHKLAKNTAILLICSDCLPLGQQSSTFKGAPGTDTAGRHSSQQARSKGKLSPWTGCTPTK